MSFENFAFTEFFRDRQVFMRVHKIAKSDYPLRHVRPFLCMERLGSHWTDFHEI
jgi:hypothetical protein